MRLARAICDVRGSRAEIVRRPGPASCGGHADWIRRTALVLLCGCAVLVAGKPAVMAAQNPPPDAPPPAAKSEAPRVFRSMQFAILRVDNRPPAKSWDVYLAEKSETLILLRQGVRYLLFDAAEKTVHEIREGHVVAIKGGVELRFGAGAAQQSGSSPGSASPASNAASAAPQLLPSADWVIRDVGPVRRFRARLTDEGRIFDVQLPLKIDGRILR